MPLCPANTEQHASYIRVSYCTLSSYKREKTFPKTKIEDTKKSSLIRNVILIDISVFDH